MKKKRQDPSAPKPKIVIEEVDGSLLKKVTGAAPGGTSGGSDANQCACACDIQDY